jgi:hydroxymethylglutaryl-CoA lyase
MARDARSLTIVEVAPRDGLQNEATPVATADKLELIEACVEAGVDRIEVASFAHPRLVPQMADAEAVIAGLSPRARARAIGLVLNQRGLERALATGVGEVNVVVSASEGFARANQHASREELVAAARAVLADAHAAGLRTSVTISVAFGCPFDGPVPPKDVVAIAEQVLDAAPAELALGDTIGAGAPGDVARLIDQIGGLAPPEALRLHFHNTRNAGIANAWEAMRLGVRTFDASMGGIGGCPFAPRATGNIATEDLVWMATRSGYATNVDLAAAIATSSLIERLLGHEVSSMVARAGAFPPS